MNVRKIVVATALVVIGVPLLLILTASISIHIADRTNGAFVSSGETRRYLLYVPKSYDSTKPTPLVISLHAAALWPAAQRATSRWNRVADQHGFIVVYPAGRDPIHLGPHAWFMGGRRHPATMPDVEFIAALMDTLERHYNIDPNRIYANGLSNGGAMTFVLSCTLSNRIAAFGTVSAAIDLPWSWCPDSTPVPMMMFHGTADPLVPYGGGKVWAAPAPFPGVREWAANWARRDHCRPGGVETRISSDVTRLEYQQCAANADVVLYTIEGGGHAWPGGKPMPAWLVGRTSTGVDASQEMWTFFANHPLHRH
jgi:polyhydroxybutyrate depolymerase